MAKARALDKRRKSIRNIRKITRTMELIATARFKKAMDRATPPRPTPSGSRSWWPTWPHSGLEVSHPLLEGREQDRASHAAGAHGQPRSVRRLQLERAAGRRCSLRRAQGARCPTSSWKSPASAASSAFKFRGITPQRDVHAFRRQAELRRSRSAGQSLSGRLRRRPARSAGRGLHAVRERRPADGGGRNAAAAGLARRAADAGRRQHGRASRSTNSCLRPRAFWKKSCRPASR